LGGYPDEAAFTSMTNIMVVNDGAGNLSFDLPSNLDLSAGHYWFSVQDVAPFGDYGQWFWSRNIDVMNDVCHWRNPNDGFGTGAVTWTGADVVFGDYNDFAFVIYGPVQEVPLSNWPIYLGLLLIGITILVRIK